MAGKYRKYKYRFWICAKTLMMGEPIERGFPNVTQDWMVGWLVVVHVCRNGAVTKAAKIPHVGPRQSNKRHGLLLGKYLYL